MHVYISYNKPCKQEFAFSRLASASKFHFFILFNVGKHINRPTEGDTLYFVKGSDARIEWSYTGTATLRTWTLTSSDMKFIKKELITIHGNEKPKIRTRELDVDVQEPATLILKNVNSSYNGTYAFEISPGTLFSEVHVFILGKPCWTTTSCFIVL